MQNGISKICSSLFQESFSCECVWFPLNSNSRLALYFFRKQTKNADRQSDRQSDRLGVRWSPSGLYIGLYFRASGDQLGDARYDYFILTETEDMNELARGISLLSLMCLISQNRFHSLTDPIMKLIIINRINPSALCGITACETKVSLIISVGVLISCYRIIGWADLFQQYPLGLCH